MEGGEEREKKEEGAYVRGEERGEEREEGEGGFDGKREGEGEGAGEVDWGCVYEENSWYARDGDEGGDTSDENVEVKGSHDGSDGSDEINGKDE